MSPCDNERGIPSSSFWMRRDSNPQPFDRETSSYPHLGYELQKHIIILCVCVCGSNTYKLSSIHVWKNMCVGVITCLLEFSHKWKKYFPNFSQPWPFLLPTHFLIWEKQVSEERSKFIPRAQENVFSDESHSRREKKGFCCNLITIILFPSSLVAASSTKMFI